MTRRRAALAAGSAAAADPDRNRATGHAAETDCAGDVEAAVAATAADRLDHGPMGVILDRADGPVEGRVDHAAETTGPGRPPDADTDGQAGDRGPGDTGRNAEATIAATTADRLGQQTGRELAFGDDGAAGVQGHQTARAAAADRLGQNTFGEASGRVDRHVTKDVDGTAGPAAGTRAADGDADRAAEADRGLGGETAAAAAAADRLGIDAT